MHRPLCKPLLTQLALNMRPRDWAEIAAVFPGDRKAWVDTMHRGAMIETRERIWLADGEPVAAGGFRLLSDDKYTAWLVGTPGLPQCGRFIHAFAIRCLVDLAEAGCKRIVAVGLDGYRVGERWLQRLGFGREGVAPYAGLNDETLTTWAWVRGMPIPTVHREDCHV